MDNRESIEFELVGDIAVVRRSGQYALDDGVHLLRDAIAQARERRHSKLMIVVVDTTGYEVPSLSRRLAMMREWADASAGFVRVVIICRPEFIDPHKFGVTMAANFGMQAEVFTTEGEGLDWLRQLDPGHA